jgi:GAF domain
MTQPARLLPPLIEGELRATEPGQLVAQSHRSGRGSWVAIPPHRRSVAEVMGALRAQCKTEERPDISTFLGQTVEQIQQLFLAGGIAVAISVRQGGEVCCVATLGPISPPLGSRVDSSSGLSGECLRSGVCLRCDDTETDPRVDREVCRQLGLRSIAVVPISSRSRTVGILEVFSAQPHAFREYHVDILRLFSDLMTTFIERRDAAVEGQVSRETSAFKQLPTGNEAKLQTMYRMSASVDLSLLGIKVTGWFSRFTRPRYYTTAISIVLVVGLFTVIERGQWRHQGVLGVAHAAGATELKAANLTRADASALVQPRLENPESMQTAKAVARPVESPGTSAASSLDRVTTYSLEGRSPVNVGQASVEAEKHVDAALSSSVSGPGSDSSGGVQLRLPSTAEPTGTVRESGNGFDVTGNFFPALTAPAPPSALRDDQPVASLKNVRKVFVEADGNGWRRSVESEISKQMGDRLAVVAAKDDADAILVGTEMRAETGQKLTARMLFAPEAKKTEVFTLYGKDRTVLWSSEADEKSAGWRTVMHRKQKRPAERLVHNLRTAMEMAK